jgi:outer membrane receptor protein involved in Fe transport
LVSFDYYAASSLEYADRPYSQTVAPGTHTPVDNRATILGAFQQQIGVDTEVAGDFAYMNRNVKRDATARPGIFLLHNYNLYESETDSYFANLGLDHELNEALTATFAASYANLEVDGYSLLRFINQPAVAPIIQTATGDVSYSALDLTAQIGGTLLTLPAGEMRFSAGAGQLDEEYNVLSRQTQYLFGEVFVPIVSEDQNVPFVERLELSLAARFTSFEDAGQDTVPKIGLLWSPISPFTIRATYGESFRAPSLAQLDPNGATNQLERALVGVTAPAPYLRVLGPMAGLAPETAETATIGFDFRPEWLGGFELSGTYFTIDYTGQIARAAQSGNAFINPAANLDILYPAPSAAYVEELLRSTRNTGNTTGLPIDFSDPASAATTLFADPNFRVLDDRFRNLALSEVEGLDASISTRFDTPIGEVGLGVQATRIFEFNKQNSPNAPIVIVVDRSLYPVDFRGRAFASLSNGGFSGTISINYVDDYTNAVAVGGSTPIESWTTADLSLTYEIGADDSARFLSGTRVSFSVQNMTDEDPPFLGSGLGTDGTLTNPIGFDPANANPLGRLVTLGVTHRW